jgi:hypothetical protein
VRFAALWEKFISKFKAFSAVLVQNWCTADSATGRQYIWIYAVRFYSA